MSTEQPRDPYSGLNFLIEIEGVVHGAFTEVSGLTAEASAHTQAEGEADGKATRSPSSHKYSSITLMRGYTPDEALWPWYKAVGKNVNYRRNIAVVLLNDRREAVMRWHLENAWIKKIEGPALNATGNEVAIEVIELEHEGIRCDRYSGSST